MARLDGKVVFISGVARGQGRSHAIRFAQEGADIIGIDALTDVGTVGYPMATQDDMDETVKLVEGLDRRILVSKVDVRDGAAVKQAVDDGVAQLGRLDAVVANAGIASFAPAEEMSQQMWDDMIDINLSGVFRSVQPCIPHLRNNEDGGAIVLISSVAGLRGVPNIVHYSAAKHGLVGMMKTLAMELAPHKIRVNTVHPTNVDTPMIQNEFTRAVFFPDRDPSTISKEEAAPAFGQTNLLPIAWVEPTEVSEAILFLISDTGRHVTGISFPIDAGYATK
jgi:SDR family mycofactocin-dependent oxidoreductase